MTAEELKRLIDDTLVEEILTIVGQKSGKTLRAEYIRNAVFRRLVGKNMIETPDTMRVLEQHNPMPEKYEPRLITVQSKAVLRDKAATMNDDMLGTFERVKVTTNITRDVEKYIEFTTQNDGRFLTTSGRILLLTKKEKEVVDGKDR